MKNKAITREVQQEFTPETVLEALLEGNKRYVNNNLTAFNVSKLVDQTIAGQFPKAVILSCIDSRVPVEIVFDLNIGDIFVARVAGNFANEDILGSMEYACKVAGSKLVVVLGHTYCGAVTSAVQQVKMGNITSMLSKIQPAIDTLEYEGEKSADNKEYLDKVCECNVKNTIKEVRLNSPILKEMEDNGEIKIVGGVYDLDTGKVDIFA